MKWFTFQAKITIIAPKILIIISRCFIPNIWITQWLRSKSYLNHIFYIYIPFKRLVPALYCRIGQQKINNTRFLYERTWSLPEIKVGATASVAVPVPISVFPSCVRYFKLQPTYNFVYVMCLLLRFYTISIEKLCHSDISSIRDRKSSVHWYTDTGSLARSGVAYSVIFYVSVPFTDTD